MNTPMTDNPVSTSQSLVIYGLILFTLATAWLTQKPSDNAYIENTPTQFSQTRALAVLKNISTFPHYTTSKHISDVREAIVSELEAMGLEVSIQKTLATSSKLFRSNQVSNIIGVLPATSGTQTSRKVLALVSHYDSRLPASPGASDAGSGVVTIVESLRAYIETGAQRKNDIIVIITDAEELGLMGAEAFVKEHPLAKDIGLVLNFEARGSGGSAYMFMETNQGNRALIDAFKKANVDYPQTNSLMYSIYKMLPNDTDLTVFKEQGNIQGFNFAFIDDHYDYHTIQDNFDRLDHH
jgi:Zn-dependent M28 family amino/carboxypeptidase